MRISFRKILALTVILTGFMFASLPAQAAERWGYESWNSSAQWKSLTFSKKDRITVTQYYKEYYRRFCTPQRIGKVQNCIAPGHQRRYTVGKALRQNLKWRELPVELAERLRMPPEGYEYVRVDSDILLIYTKSRKVMDAIVLESDGSVAGNSLLPIVNSYVVYFDPRTAALRAGENRILNIIAREMTQYNPRQVTVTSYADSVIGLNSGQGLTDERMQMLFTTLEAFGMNVNNVNQVNPNNAGLIRDLSTISRNQEAIVSRELTKRNVPNVIVKSQQRGRLESKLASQDEFSADEIQMVVIDFRK